MAATARAAVKGKRPTVPRRDAGTEIVDLGDPDEAAAPEREVVFKIGGVEHTMLKNPGPSIALSGFELAERRGGTEQAAGFADVYIMREMLGAESYRALLDCRTMTRDQFIRISTRVMTRAMGALEDEDGSPNR
jgi:hypothetical protein